MGLTPGAKLGAYEIVSAIGAGGMGEVYRARDRKLGRDVAIKVLPDLFASDPERLARFQREAQLLASLNHPHIGAIYGLEESDPSPGSGRLAVRNLDMGRTGGTGTTAATTDTKAAKDTNENDLCASGGPSPRAAGGASPRRDS